MTPRLTLARALLLAACAALATTLAAMLLLGCGTTGSYRAPEVPSLGMVEAAAPVPPPFALPSPSIRRPDGMNRAALAGRTIGLIIRGRPAPSTGDQVGAVSAAAEALLPGIGPIISLLGIALPGLAPDVSLTPGLADRFADELLFAWASRGELRALRLHELGSVRAEVEKGEQAAVKPAVLGAAVVRTPAERVTISGGLPYVALVANVTKADVVVDIELATAAAGDVVADEKAVAKFKHDFDAYRMAVDESLKSANGALESYRSAAATAEDAYGRQVALAGAVCGGVCGGSVDTDAALRPHREENARVLAKIEALIGRIQAQRAAIPKDADAALQQARARTAGGGATTATARIAVDEPATGTLSFFATAQATGPSPEAAVDELVRYLTKEAL